MKQDLQNTQKSDTILYQVKDVQGILKIGRSSAYRLMASKGFPSIMLNKRRVVQKEKFERWLDQQAGKAVFY